MKKIDVLSKFLRYVKYDTQSDATSNTTPSTSKQLRLAKLLANELKKIGGQKISIKYGYVYAFFPANIKIKHKPLALIAHLDTAGEVSGANVKPIVWKKYQGQNLILNKEQIIKTIDNPDLKNKIGEDIITTNGETLLGADDKAGLAEIMTAMEYLKNNPTIKHGDIYVVFTPDEEIGRGWKKLDYQKCPAKFGYTVDGGFLGELNIENFYARSFEIRFYGKAQHPGDSYKKMVNAQKPATWLIANLPSKTMSPETTKDRQGFIHLLKMSGTVEEAELSIFLRAFEKKELVLYENILKKLAQKAIKKYPGSRFETKPAEQYNNMKEITQKYPIVVEKAKKAMQRIGIKPVVKPIRGGTDGSMLSFNGLVCPNIFAGGHNMHSRLEWISKQDMEKAVLTIIEIVRGWNEEKL